MSIRTAAMAGVPVPMATVVPGALFAVGGGVPSAMSVSWIPAALGGWMPVQCYVFRDGADAMVLDGGLGADTDCVGRGLCRVLHGAKVPRLLVSRWEPDSMVNLPWLIERLGAREVLSYGGINPLDFFEGFEAASARVQVEAAAGPARLVPIAPGDVLEVGSLRIEVLTANLRLLLTSWFFERTTGSLFTADSFGFLPNFGSPFPFVTQPRPDQLSPEILYRSLRTKFDWLSGARCEALIADIERIRSQYLIERICPTFGGIIEGRENVGRVFTSAVSALQRLQAETPPAALSGFNWERALGAASTADLSDPRRVPLTIMQCAEQRSPQAPSHRASAVARPASAAL